MNAGENLCLDTQFLQYIHDIESDLFDFVGKIVVFAEHTRQSVVFRAHPNFCGKGLWRDWVMIEWQSGEYPAQIWGFLDLSGLPRGRSFRLSMGVGYPKGFGQSLRAASSKK